MKRHDLPVVLTIWLYDLPDDSLKWLTLPVPISDEERKSTSIFIFTLLCCASKTFWGTTKKYENKNFRAYFRMTGHVHKKGHILVNLQQFADEPPSPCLRLFVKFT